MPLSDTFVKQTKHSGRPTGDKHSDGGGLYLHVMAAGKYWRMAYRFGGRQKTLALGVYPAVSLAQARKRREEARAWLAEGVDPSEAKKAREAEVMASTANTVQAVGDAWLKTKKGGWSDSHYKRESRNLSKDLYPFIGSRPIGSIEPPELLKVIRKVEERGALDVAHRVLLTARGVWQYAVAEGHAQRDITQDIKKALQTHTKQNYPAITNPAKLGELLRACDGYKGGPVVRAALAIVPVLFQRPGNIRAMRWADIDLENGMWAIPSADMKRTKAQKLNGAEHLVPLPRQVVAVLRELQPLTGHREYVFPGLRDPKTPMSEAAVSAALNAMGYRGIQTWHGYRATGRTMIREQLRYPKDVIEYQLAHRGQITHGGAYDRAEYLEERRAMLQAWADYLDKLKAGAEVVRLQA
ncbi:tyrosine-type recombinase/integrase [Comamonas humi]